MIATHSVDPPEGRREGQARFPPAADRPSIAVSVPGMAATGFNLATVKARDLKLPLPGRILAVRRASAAAWVAAAFGLVALTLRVMELTGLSWSQ